MSYSTPTVEQKEDILLSARYGELEEVQEFVKAFGSEFLAGVRDENGNTVLHMACGNGHTGETFITRFSLLCFWKRSLPCQCISMLLVNV